MKIGNLSYAFALGTAALGLAGCNQGAEPAEQAVGGGIAVTNGRMVLNAVSGNPAAIYFDLANNGERAITVRGASVANAESAMLHDYQEWDRQMVMGEMAPLSLQPGDTVSFAPGSRHIMAVGVSPQTQAGGTTEVTLNLLGGGTHSFPVSILPAGSIDETAPPLPPIVGGEETAAAEDAEPAN